MAEHVWSPWTLAGDIAGIECWYFRLCSGCLAYQRSMIPPVPAPAMPLAFVVDCRACGLLIQGHTDPLEVQAARDVHNDVHHHGTREALIAIPELGVALLGDIP